ncbi:MAG: GH32 C-terminal domain-containing protein [Kiritimatiellaeota bacterium]|nr:GH32 C-terminal domain-containing protein [Kiritimatiellota bacterium]
MKRTLFLKAALLGAAIALGSAALHAAENGHTRPPAERQQTAPVMTYSLAGDFSYTDNRTNSTWSYRLDDFTNSPHAFPLLPSAKRDANALWGSDFPAPPLMWSDAAGYWGIGRNLTGRELYSTRNGTKWAPGEVLFHPKDGAPPSGLVVGWTAPGNMVINVHYSLGRGTGQGADITVKGRPVVVAGAMAARPAGGTIAAGSDFTFSVPTTAARTFQWRKDGQPIAGATDASYRISDAKISDAGTYSVAIDSVPSLDAMLNVTPMPSIPVPERFPSPVPRQVFSETLAEQEKELKTNALMLRFAESRKKLAVDRYRPAYHYVSPESSMNDPNALVFWQGRWHLFFIAMPPDEFPNPADVLKRWLRTSIGHAVSDDLVHWQDLPYAINPGIESACYSGGMLVEKARVIAFYPGMGAGQMVAVSKDPLLLNWEKRGPVNTELGDSCIWKENDTYYGLTGQKVDYRPNIWWPQMNLWASKDLVTWQGLGGFIEDPKTPLTARRDDGACPNFQPIGDKYILSFFSHSNGGQYFLGDYDKTLHKFRPYEHGRFNHGTVAPGGVHAPRTAADGNGGVLNILNFNHGKPSDDWDQMMSLTQRLTLGPDKLLRIEPVAAVASLRGGHQHVGETVIPANEEIVLQAIKGNTMELEVEIDPKMSHWVQLNVLRSPHAEEQTSITFYNYDKKLSFWYDTRGVVCLDGARSSTLPDVWVRPPERAEMERGGEMLKLRVFIDRSVVEVFAHGRQYLAMRVYPGRQDSVGVSVRAQGQDAVLKKLDAWQMQSIWPKPE